MSEEHRPECSSIITNKCNKKIDRLSPEVIAVSDPFCWICHQRNTNRHCYTCIRSYHSECIGRKESKKHPFKYQCKLCTKLEAEKLQYSERNVDVKKVHKLLWYTANRLIESNQFNKLGKKFNRLRQPVVPGPPIIKPIDLNIVLAKVEESRYTTTLEFINDIKLIRHNAEIVLKKKDKRLKMAKNLEKWCRKEIYTIGMCEKCFYRTNSMHKWITSVCDQPHLLVWARMNGVFWPAKVIGIADMVRKKVCVSLFGKHEMYKVEQSKCLLFTKESPNEGVDENEMDRMNTALKEANTYISNLGEKYSCDLVLANTRRELDIDRIDEYLTNTIPGLIANDDQLNRKSTHWKKSIVSVAEKQIEMDKMKECSVRLWRCDGMLNRSQLSELRNEATSPIQSETNAMAGHEKRIDTVAVGVGTSKGKTASLQSSTCIREPSKEMITNDETGEVTEVNSFSEEHVGQNEDEMMVENEIKRTGGNENGNLNSAKSPLKGENDNKLHLDGSSKKKRNMKSHSTLETSSEPIQGIPSNEEQKCDRRKKKEYNNGLGMDKRRLKHCKRHLHGYLNKSHKDLIKRRRKQTGAKLSKSKTCARVVDRRAMLFFKEQMKVVKECSIRLKRCDDMLTKDQLDEMRNKARIAIKRKMRRGQTHNRKSALKSEFKCKKCAEEFSWASDLKRHMRMHVNLFDFHCANCRQGFDLEEEKESHEKTCDCKIFQCESCEYHTPFKSHFDTHMRTHTGEKPFSCRHCLKLFSQKGNLFAHLKRNICHSESKQMKENTVIDNGLSDNEWNNSNSVDCDTGITLEPNLHTDDENKATPNSNLIDTQSSTNVFREIGEIQSTCQGTTNDCIIKTIGTTDEEYGNNVKNAKKNESKQIKCDFCEYSTKCIHRLTSHRRIHTGERPFKCEKCTKRFPEKYGLKRHMRLHANELAFQCKICRQGFDSEETKNSHEKTCNCTRYECDLCGYQALHESRLHVHMTTHTGEKPFSCMQCSKLFNRKFNLFTHVKKIHGKNVKELANIGRALHRNKNSLSDDHNDNGMDYSVAAEQVISNLEMTIASDQMETDQIDEAETVEGSMSTSEIASANGIVTDQIGRIDCTENTDQNLIHSQTLGIVTKSIEDNLPNEQQTNETEVIGAADRLDQKESDDATVEVEEQSSNRKQCEETKNEKNAKENGSKQYKCEFCGYSTKKKYDLKVHRRKHTGEKPFKCRECAREFTQGSNLKTHMRTHANEFAFTCAICLKGFDSEEAKNSHEKTCNCTRYQCDLLIKTNLIRHVRTHTGEKPFGCSHCLKSFTHKSILNRHMKRCHSKGKNVNELIITGESQETLHSSNQKRLRNDATDCDEADIDRTHSNSVDCEMPEHNNDVNGMISSIDGYQEISFDAIASSNAIETTLMPEKSNIAMNMPTNDAQSTDELSTQNQTEEVNTSEPMPSLLLDTDTALLSPDQQMKETLNVERTEDSNDLTPISVNQSSSGYQLNQSLDVGSQSKTLEDLLVKVLMIHDERAKKQNEIRELENELRQKIEIEQNLMHLSESIRTCFRDHGLILGSNTSTSTSSTLSSSTSTSDNTPGGAENSSSTKFKKIQIDARKIGEIDNNPPIDGTQSLCVNLISQTNACAGGNLFGKKPEVNTFKQLASSFLGETMDSSRGNGGIGIGNGINYSVVAEQVISNVENAIASHHIDIEETDASKTVEKPFLPKKIINNQAIVTDGVNQIGSNENDGQSSIGPQTLGTISVTVLDASSIEQETNETNVTDADHRADQEVCDGATVGGEEQNCNRRQSRETQDEKNAKENGPKQHKCEFCEYSTKYKDRLTQHRRKHTGEKPFKCERCAREFSQSYSLKLHMRIHANEFAFNCSICRQGFDSELVKNLHEKTCNCKRYQCDLCGYRTLQKPHLNAHMRTHTGEKPFVCLHCSKTYNRKSTLNRHMKMIHGKSEKNKKHIITGKGLDTSNSSNRKRLRNGAKENRKTGNDPTNSIACETRKSLSDPQLNSTSDVNAMIPSCEVSSIEETIGDSLSQTDDTQSTGTYAIAQDDKLRKEIQEQGHATNQDGINNRKNDTVEITDYSAAVKQIISYSVTTIPSHHIVTEPIVTGTISNGADLSTESVDFADRTNDIGSHFNNKHSKSNQGNPPNELRSQSNMTDFIHEQPNLE